MGDDTLAAAVWALMRDDVVPTLRQPDGLDLDDYCRQVMVRFANPALRHRTTQVAMDGTQKLPVRVLGTIRDRLAAGVVPEPASMVVAGWMAYMYERPRTARHRCHSTIRSLPGCARL